MSKSVFEKWCVVCGWLQKPVDFVVRRHCSAATVSRREGDPHASPPAFSLSLDQHSTSQTRSKLVAPSILSADFANLEKEIQAIAKAGADWVHVDVMDGHFVNNITIGPAVVASLKKISPLPLDVHLMIENPEKYIEAFARAGSDYLTIHVEASSNCQELLSKIRALGSKPGITLRPSTPLESILPFLSLVDLVLIMTVEPGFSGQSFMHNQMSKIKKLVDLRSEQNLSFLIEVDGGVNAETIAECFAADVFVAGNYVFKNNYAQSIQTLKNGTGKK